MIWLFWLLGPARAADTDATRFSATANMWLAAQQTSAFNTNSDGIQGGQGGHINGRQVVGLGLENDSIGVQSAVGVQQYQLAGATWDVPGDVDERHRHVAGKTMLHLRQMSVEAKLPVVNIETGLMTSHWGLGMLANDGLHEPYFGLPEFGDRVIRARATTKPIENSPWFVTGAIDRVIQDDMTIDPSRQWAQQAILSVLWKTESESAGVYAVARSQDEMDTQRYTRLGVIDGYIDLTRPLNDLLSVNVAIEAAAISGKTNRTTSYEARERLLIRSAGATGHSMLRTDLFATGAGFGYASGDGDPTDDELNDFTFDRNHGVGMVLFDEVSGAIEATTYLDLADPEHAGSPPDGLEMSVTEGAFRRAVYIQPRIELDPTKWLHIRSGWLFAWSTAPVLQPFATARNGGVPLNHLGLPTNGYRLGNEIDWLVRFKPHENALRKSVGHGIAVDVQGGHARTHKNWGGSNVNRFIVALRVN